jgi:hypothetical protein
MQFQEEGLDSIPSLVKNVHCKNGNWATNNQKDLWRKFLTNNRHNQLKAFENEKEECERRARLSGSIQGSPSISVRERGCGDKL